MKVTAKLREDALGSLLDFDSREAWLIARLENCLAEISVSREEWERFFNLSWPGVGYLNLMKEQRDLLIRQIKAETGEDVEC